MHDIALSKLLSSRGPRTNTRLRVCTASVETQSRELVLGRSLSEFMRTLGSTTTAAGGGAFKPGSATK